MLTSLLLFHAASSFSALPVAMTFALTVASDVFVGLLAAIHVYIFYLEALIWTRGAGRAFGVKAEHIEPTGALAANQGFYNLVLAAGLVWSIAVDHWSAKTFFAGAVLCCGVFGYITTGNAKILRAQCVPATIALILLFVAEATLLPLAVGLATLGVALFFTPILSYLVRERLCPVHGTCAEGFDEQLKLVH